MKRRDLFGKAFREAPFAQVLGPSRWDHELAARLSRLPLAIARADALAELAAGRVFRGTKGFLSEPERARVAALEAESRALFERYRSVETNTVVLSVGAIDAVARASLFTRIGSDAVLGNVLVTLAAPSLYVVPADAAPPFAARDAVASVWHYLLYLRESRGGA